eukprot:scaffold157293_cov46-Prasinocladus_malaysianus.AAC.3
MPELREFRNGRLAGGASRELLWGHGTVQALSARPGRCLRLSQSTWSITAFNVFKVPPLNGSDWTSCASYILFWLTLRTDLAFGCRSLMTAGGLCMQLKSLMSDLESPELPLSSRWSSSVTGWRSAGRHLISIRLA